MMKLAEPIAFSLLKPMLSGQALVLCFENGQRNGFGVFGQWLAKQVVCSPRWPAISLASNEVDLCSSLLDPNIFATPTAMIDQHRIDQFKTCLGFVSHPWRFRL